MPEVGDHFRIDRNEILLPAEADHLFLHQAVCEGTFPPRLQPPDALGAGLQLRFAPQMGDVDLRILLRVFIETGESCPEEAGELFQNRVHGLSIIFIGRELGQTTVPELLLFQEVALAAEQSLFFLLQNMLLGNVVGHRQQQRVVFIDPDVAADRVKVADGSIRVGIGVGSFDQLAVGRNGEILLAEPVRNFGHSRNIAIALAENRFFREAGDALAGPVPEYVAVVVIRILSLNDCRDVIQNRLKQPVGGMCLLLRLSLPVDVE